MARFIKLGILEDLSPWSFTHQRLIPAPKPGRGLFLIVLGWRIYSIEDITFTAVFGLFPILSTRLYTNPIFLYYKVLVLVFLYRSALLFVVIYGVFGFVLIFSFRFSVILL